jgi:hypothetical protein
MMSQEKQQEWVLRPSGFVVHKGDVVEYRSPDGSAVVGTVTHVSEGVYPAPGQFVGISLSAHLPRRKKQTASLKADRSVMAENVLAVLAEVPVPPKWQVELLYPKHHFHQLPKAGKIHVVRNEVTPLWGGPPVDRSEHTLCGLSTAESQCLNERDLPRERICGSCLRNLRLFRLSGDDWRKRGQYLREYPQRDEG